MLTTLLMMLAQDAGKPADGALEAAKAHKNTLAETATLAIDRPISVFEKVTNEVVTFTVGKGPAVVSALVIFIVAWIFSKWVRKALITGLTRAKVDVLLAKFFANMGRWAVIAFAVVICLGTLGIETTSLAAVIGAMGLAIGLALQGNLGNLASGVLLLIFQPFKIGDSVIVAGQTGVIDGIDLFTTNLDTADNRRIIVPNSAIFGGVIENQTHHPRRAVTVPVPVSGAIEMERSEAILREMLNQFVASTPGALRDPAPSVTLAEIAPTVTWNVTVWADTLKFGTIRPNLLRAIKMTVEREKLGPPQAVQLVRSVS